MDADIERRVSDIDRIIVTIDARCEALRRALGSKQQVKRKKALVEILEPIDEAGKFMQGLVRLETGQERAQLKAVFGDCRRVARIHEATNKIKELFGKSYLSKVARLTRCLQACESVEGVLNDSGFREKLAAARADAQREMEQMSVPQTDNQAREAAVEEAPPTATRELPAPPTVTHEPTVSSASLREQKFKLLQDIDAADSEEEALEKIDALFTEYMYGNADWLEGDSYEACITDLMDHVLREASERIETYGGYGTVPTEELTKAWVISKVDPNGDGAITREEARVGFLKVVNDIEFGADYVRKRTSLRTSSNPFLRDGSKSSAGGEKPSKAEQIEALAVCEDIDLPSAAGSVLVFGCGRPELPRHLCELLVDHPRLGSLPVLLTGTEGEIDALTTALRGNPALQNLQIEADPTASSTHDNARWAAQKLEEMNLMGQPIIFVAFPVLARGGIDALRFFRVPRYFIHPMFPASKIDVDDPSIQDAWVQSKYDAIGKAWSGKP